MPDDYIAQLMAQELAPGVPLVPVALGILFLFALIFFFKRRKPNEMERPDLIEPDKVVKEEFRDLIKSTGTSPGHDILLRQGPVTKGKIMSWAFYHYDPKKPQGKNNKDNKAEGELKAIIEGNPQEDNFFLLDVIPYRWFILFAIIQDMLYYVFGWGSKFYLVDREYVTTGPLEYNISIYAQQHREYPGVYVFSQEGKLVVKEDIVDHLTYKQILKDTVNHIPQMHYFDFTTGKYAAKSREFREGKKRSWKDQEENLEREAEE